MLDDRQINPQEGSLVERLRHNPTYQLHCLYCADCCYLSFRAQKVTRRFYDLPDRSNAVEFFLLPGALGCLPATFRAVPRITDHFLLLDTDYLLPFCLRLYR